MIFQKQKEKIVDTLPASFPHSISRLVFGIGTQICSSPLPT